MLELLVEPIVRNALLEDIGRGDVTTGAIADDNLRSTAFIKARESGVVAGHQAAMLAFRILDPHSRYTINIPEGGTAKPADTVAQITATQSALLTGERTALNFLCHLSGIATATRTMVDLIAEYPARVVCTRKTTPGLRLLEKAAVVAGGASNHRFGLDDAVLIKDNHIALAGGIGAAVAAVRKRIGHMVKIEVEVDDLNQLREALALPIDAVLLDNMEPQMLAEAVKLVAARIVTEASGRVTAERIVEIARSGVDMISVGWITHSAPALDLGLDTET